MTIPSCRTPLVCLVLCSLLALHTHPLLARAHTASADTAHVRLLGARSHDLLYTQPEEALQYAQQALALAYETAHRPSIAASLKAVGNVHFVQERFTRALEVYRHARTLYAATEDRRGVAESLVSIGNVFTKRNEETRALDYYLEALRTFEQLGHKGEVARTLGNIATVHRQQNNLPQALDYYNRTIRLLEEPGSNRLLLAGALANVGSLFRAQGAYDDAIAYNRRALAIYEDENDRYGMALAYNNIGVALNRQGHPAQALAPLNEAISIHQTLRADKYLAYTYDEVGRAYLALGRLDSALTYATQSVALAEETGSLRLLQLVNRTLARIHAARGDYERAYAHQQRYGTVKDSLFNVEKAEIITQMQTRYETERKEHQIDSLRQRSRIQALQARQRQNVLLGGLGGLLLVAGFLYNRYRIKHKANHLLERQNEEIEQKREALQASLAEKDLLLEEKELLVQEIHHRVKNNLQVITSLLNTQQRTLQDRPSQAAVREVQGRVQAMALIHHKLYRTQNLARVDAQEYIEALATFLLQAMADGHGVRCRVHASGIHLSPDTAVPLGLIVNELLSNALKYAFPEGSGHIKVVLREVRLRAGADGYELEVSDDGVGLPPPFCNGEGPTTMGLRLVKDMTRQLDGTLHIQNEVGATYRIRFHKT